MKKGILLLSIVLVVMSTGFLIIFPKASNVTNRIPYTPIDYKNVDKVYATGFAKESIAITDIKKFVKCVNEIKKYQKEDKPVYHSTPGPYWNISITLKYKQVILIYKDYDGKSKISDWHKAYIINEAIVQKILRKNGLHPVTL
jgi:hypothetical protein